MTALTTYRVTFTRIGRDRSPAPLTVHAATGDHLAEVIYKHVRSQLLSGSVDVDLDLAAGTGTIYAGPRTAGTFTVTTDTPEPGAAAGAEPRVPIDQFGRDHWSTFLYAEARAVDHHGVLWHDHMRCHASRHPAVFTRKRHHPAGREGGADGSRYPTILKGNVELVDHDDYDCLADLEAVGLLEQVGLDEVRLTPRGHAVAAELRTFKASGGDYATFTPTAVPA